MKEESAILENIEEEVWYSYGNEMYTALSKCVKQFLVDYFGDRFYNLESETYRALDAIIKKDLEIYGNSIPDIFYRYRTITDPYLWGHALNKFEIAGKHFPWPKTPQWFDNTGINEEENDDDALWGNIFELEMTEEQKMARLLFESLKEMANFHIAFSNFMRQGCGMLVTATQHFIEKTAEFELSILSPEGFLALQTYIEMIADSIFDKLYGLMADRRAL